MCKQRKFIIALLALSFCPAASFAAAWTLPKDDFALYQNAFYYSTDTYFDAQGQRRSQPRYSKIELNPYAEYGWKNGTTLGASVALDAVTATNGRLQQGTNYGLSDPSLFLRQRLWNNETTVVSVQPLVKLPSVYLDGSLPQSGTNQTDAELRVLAGHSFAWFDKNHYANVEAAYRKRFDDPEDQLRADAILGFTLNDDWQILPQLSLTRSTANTNAMRFTQSNEDDHNLLKGQLSAVYHWNKNISLQAGAFSHLSGNNTGNGSGVLLSLWYHP